MRAKSTQARQTLVALMAMCLAAALATSVTATTYHVDGATGDDNNDGLQWSTAFKTPQKALLHPQLTSGDQIWVAAWTYYPDEGPTQQDDNRGETFRMVEGVSVFGGFLNGDSFEDRDPVANVTVLSGDVQQNGIFGTVTYLRPG